MAAAGQRWKVCADGGVAVRVDRRVSSEELPERLPKGAIVSELEREDGDLRYLRVSSEGPQSGWVSLAEGGRELLEPFVPQKRKAPEPQPSQPPPAARPKAPEDEGKQLLVSTGGRWLVVAEEGLTVRKGQRKTSQKLEERLPAGVVLEEVEVAGDRLHFLNTTGLGPSSGWVSIADKGKELLERLSEPSDPVTSFEGMKRGFLGDAPAELYPEGSPEGAQPEAEAGRPLEGWASLSELFARDVLGARQPAGVAAAAETAARRKRFVKEELPPIEDLESLDEATLMDVLGFDSVAAREFAGLSRPEKRKMIAEAKALLEMGPEKRTEALDAYRQAWPRGPFPELAPPAEEGGGLPPGSCFPYSRQLRDVPRGLAPEWGLEAPAGRAVRSFFRRGAGSAPEAQREFLRSLRCELAAASGSVAAAAGVGLPEPSGVGDLADAEQLAAAIASKSAVRFEDVCRYFNGELQRRVCVLDGDMASRLGQEGLEEQDFRGERFKNFKETDVKGQPISLKGNLEMLVLTKASLVAEVHKEYLQAGADVVRTLTFGCNALTQKEYRMNKLVFEMNKSAAQLAKKAAAEVTRSEPTKPRFVAGVIGPTPCMMSLTPGAKWSDMMEAYDEQIKGLVEGGVDILMLDGITDALNAKAALFAVEDFLERTKRKRVPVMVSAQTAAGGRTPSGQSPEAFCISVKHAKPLAIGLSSAEGPGAMMGSCRALAELCPGWLSATPSAAGEDPDKFASGLADYAKEGLLNFAGGGAGALPAHIAALARGVKSAGVRRLPAKPAAYLQLSGLDACLSKPDEAVQVVGSGCTTMGSARFKKLVGAYKATSKRRYLEEALEMCVEQCDKGADILDFNLDSDIASGPACPAKGAMRTFMQMASAEPRVARVPFMLCSCQWDTIRDGLRCVQGKCVVNGLTLTLGEDEFLRIARECKRHGAALVVLAVTDSGEPAESYEDKVRICQQSYRLLRSKLDFPPEDIIFDCQVLLLGLPEFASRAADFIRAVGELKRTCPGASFAGGVNNLSLAFRGLSMLRDALHSVFLYHAVPKGLNLAMAWPGALPTYPELDAETRALCEEVILNRSSDGNHLERFNAFVNFRSNSVPCLPVRHPGPPRWAEDEQGNWVRPPAVQKEAREAQRALRAQQRKSKPAAQKSLFQNLRCSVDCSAEALKPEAGAALADVCRADGPVNRDGLANTVVAKGTARPDDLAKYLNAELRKRVCVFATPGQSKKLGESDYRDYFGAGCDICGTNTLEVTAYDESKSAAQAAKSAAAEATKKDSQKPRFVAGVIGPPSSATWDEMVSTYAGQVRGLVDGGVDLLAIEGASSSMGARAAIFAIDAYFGQTKKERLPLVVTAAVDENGRLPSGQSATAFLISIKHARPLSVGVAGAPGQGGLQKAAKALAGLSLSWCHVSASAGAGESAEAIAGGLAQLATDKLANLVGASGATAAQLGAVAGKAKAASPRALPGLPKAPALQLSGLEACLISQDEVFHVVGQRCNMGGSKKFRGYVDAYKYTKEGNTWEAARELCSEQCQAGADILDVNLDSELTDSKWAIGKFMGLCGTDPKAASAPFMLSSASWAVIEEGLRSAPGKSIVNAISMVRGEEEFLHMARACQRYGAAVVVVTMEAPDEFPAYQEKVRIGQRAYKLLRTKLDFPAEDIIFDCSVLPLGSPEPVKDFMDAVAELKRTCPLVSFVAGVGNLSLPFRALPPLREALHSVFLYHAIPMGLNLAIVDAGALPLYSDIEAQTKKACEEAVLQESSDSGALDRLESYASYLSGSAVEEISTALVPQYDLPLAIPPPKRRTPGYRQPMNALVQGTGTINASVFQTFGSKSHAALNFHKNMASLAVKRTVWFSSISAWMGQGGSGPITGCSCLMDGLALHERWEMLGNVGVAVEWGAIGEIGLRRTVYGSRDVFAQFDLGQKLIGPADTQILMRQTCVGIADPYEVVGMAYLDQTWQMTLAGVTSGGALERKSFADL